MSDLFYRSCPWSQDRSNAVQLSVLPLRHAAARQKPSIPRYFVLCTFLGVAGGTPEKQQG